MSVLSLFILILSQILLQYLGKLLWLMWTLLMTLLVFPLQISLHFFRILLTVTHPVLVLLMTILLPVTHLVLMWHMLLTIRLHYSMMMATPCMIILHQLLFLQMDQGLYLRGLSPLLLIQQSFLLVHPHAIRRNLLHLEPFLLKSLIVFKVNLMQLSFLLSHLCTIKRNLLHHGSLLNF